MDELVQRIATDHRHSDFRLLAQHVLPKRMFGDFSMGYLYDPSYAEQNARLFDMPGLPSDDVWERCLELACAADRFS